MPVKWIENRVFYPRQESDRFTGMSSRISIMDIIQICMHDSGRGNDFTSVALMKSLPFDPFHAIYYYWVVSEVIADSK